MKFKTEISAGGIVYKKEHNQIQWLVIQNSTHKGWGFPKGRVGDKIRDESFETAALREVAEEGGITAKIITPTTIDINYMYRFQDYLIKKTVHYFLMEYQSGNIEDHDHEVADLKFIPSDEVEKSLTHKGDKEAFKKIISLFESLKH